MAAPSTFHMRAEKPRYTFFLSHRGPDSRQSIARPLSFILSQLGFQHFFLDEDAREAERNSDTFTRDNDKAIRDALYSCQYGILIISPRFHESKWCVHELDTFLERSQDQPDFLIPIYYKVTPDDERYQSLRRLVKHSALVCSHQNVLGFLCNSVLPRLLSLKHVQERSDIKRLSHLEPTCRLTKHLQFLFQPSYSQHLARCGQTVPEQLTVTQSCGPCDYHSEPSYSQEQRAGLLGIARQQLGESDIQACYVDTYVHYGLPKNIKTTMKHLDSIAEDPTAPRNVFNEMRWSWSGPSYPRHRTRDVAESLVHIDLLFDSLLKFLAPEQPEPLLLLTGEAGTGKTTATVHLMAVLNGLVPNINLSFPWVPVRLHLQNYSVEDMQKDIVSLLKQSPYKPYISILRDSSVVFILDGYDELQGVKEFHEAGRRLRLLQDLQVHHYFSRSKVILTCRHDEKRGVPLQHVYDVCRGEAAQHTLLHYFLLPLPITNVRYFLTRYHEQQISNTHSKPSHVITRAAGHAMFATSEQMGTMKKKSQVPPAWEQIEPFLAESTNLRVPFVLSMFAEGLVAANAKIEIRRDMYRKHNPSPGEMQVGSAVNVRKRVREVITVPEQKRSVSISAKRRRMHIPPAAQLWLTNDCLAIVLSFLSVIDHVNLAMTRKSLSRHILTIKSADNQGRTAQYWKTITFEKVLQGNEVLRTQVDPTVVKHLLMSTPEGSPEEVTDDDLAHLCSATNVLTLDLVASKLKSLTPINSLEHLRVLKLYRIRNEEASKSLPLLGSLKELHLSRASPFTTDFARRIGTLTSLTVLDVSWTVVHDKCLGELATLTNLQVLDISGCRHVTDAGLEHLAAFTQLRRLTMAMLSRITDAGLGYLVKLKLTHLDVSLCSNLTSACVSDYIEHISSLEHLKMVGLRHVTDIMGIDRLRRLSCLDLSGSAVTSDSLMVLKWGRLDHLKQLDLSTCFNLTRGCLVHLYYLQSLRELNLAHIGSSGDIASIPQRGCPYYPLGLDTAAYCEHMMNLAAIDLTGSVSPQDYIEICKKLPGVTVRYDKRNVYSHEASATLLGISTSK